jgi:integrase
LLKELENYWRAQRRGKAGHDSPWLFLGKKAGEPMGRYTGQNIYYSALKKSGARRKGGIHLLQPALRHSCDPGVSSSMFLDSCRRKGKEEHSDLKHLQSVEQCFKDILCQYLQVSSRDRPNELQKTLFIWYL